MSKILNETREVFVTTDDEVFTDVANAEKHQINLNKSELVTNLTNMIREMFKVPTMEEVDTAYDDARALEDDDKDDEAKKMFDKNEKMDSMRDDFFQKCGLFNTDYEMKDIADNFILLYQEFGFIRLKKILVFINDALED